MNEILNREKIYEWEMRPYGYATGVECGIYPHELEQLYDSHEALRKRVEELEKVLQELIDDFVDDHYCGSTQAARATAHRTAVKARQVLEDNHE